MKNIKYFINKFCLSDFSLTFTQFQKYISLIDFTALKCTLINFLGVNVSQKKVQPFTVKLLRFHNAFILEVKRFKSSITQMCMGFV